MHYKIIYNFKEYRLSHKAIISRNTPKIIVVEIQR